MLWIMYKINVNKQNPFEQKLAHLKVPETDIMGQFLGPETDIIGKRYYILELHTNWNQKFC